MLFFYAVTLFVSATLLFVVQPMVGKMILPTLGGTPAVWNTCMFFFQAVLLAGYAYAHGSVAWLGVRRQAGLHIILLLIPLSVLPIYVAIDTAPPAGGNPVVWLLLRLVVSVGLPLFLVSSTAPLLQKWFAQTRHPSARDPYFLYAASNAGSLLALLCYPLLVERNLMLGEQSRFWSFGYIALIALAIGCAVVAWSSSPLPGAERDSTLSVTSTKDGAGNGASGGLTLKRRVWWILLTTIPSSLLLGVTSHITTNVAAVPLLWVIPLALYLSTFILVFARKTLVPHALMVRLVPYVLLSLGPMIYFGTSGVTWLEIPIHLVTFFVVAMMCHGELARTRPSTAYLTEFYLWISVGGVLGGLFNAIVAPLVFDTIVEYPLMLVLACFLLPRPGSIAQAPRERRLDLALPGVLAGAGLGIVFVLKYFSWHESWYAAGTLIILLAITCFGFKDRPTRFGLGFAVFLTTLATYGRSLSADRLLVERNFFGVKSVAVHRSGKFRVLIHGNTNHGIQWIDPARRREPTAYYHRQGPVGDIFSALHETDLLQQVAIIGLGAGGLACYAEPGRHFTFYEIDPAVDRIAHDTAYFTFLADCRGTYEIVLGDGRLRLAQAPDRRYGLIIMDAFSSDAIPTHLLSQEAVESYLEKLDEHGILVFHISNAYLNLEPVLANLAHHAGLICLHRSDAHLSPQEQLEGRFPSHYVAMARRSEDFGPLIDNPRWERLPAVPQVPVWTDQFCDILSVFRDPRRPTRGVR